VLVTTVVIAGGSVGCSPVQPAVAVQRRDSIGVEIVHSLANDEATWPRCAISPEPLLRIGSQDSHPEYELYEVEDARLLRNGRIAVVNRGTDEVRVFNSTGEFEFSVGREGEGPGEFQDPIEVSVLPPDSLVVWDWDLGRLSVFNEDGVFVRSILPQPAVPNPTGHFGIISATHPFLIASHDFQPPTGTGFVPQWLRLLRYERNGALIDTAATLPYGTRARVPEGGPVLVGRPLFEARGVFEVVGDKIATANGSEPEVQLWDTEGRLVRVIRWQPPNRVVTPADAEAFRENALEGVDVDFVRKAIAARSEAMPVSTEFPALWDVKHDPAGFMWVRLYPRPNSEVNTWLGFDSTGAFDCALTVPRGFMILDFGNNIALGRTTDELDVEYVELYGVAREIGR
jgi:hypothetical protein